MDRHQDPAFTVLLSPVGDMQENRPARSATLRATGLRINKTDYIRSTVHFNRWCHCGEELGVTLSNKIQVTDMSSDVDVQRVLKRINTLLLSQALRKPLDRWEKGAICVASGWMIIFSLLYPAIHSKLLFWTSAYCFNQKGGRFRVNQ